MLSTVVAISGMLAAAPAARAGAALDAVEITFVTHAGEGAAGRKRFTRDGCYQVESGGGTGGAGYARDSQAGCHRTADVAPVFARLDAIGTAALAREGAADGGARGAPARGLLPGGGETRVVLIRPDGSRWAAVNQATADEILRAINELPGENQWYATPPEKAVGTGAQLVVLSATYGGGARRFEAALASDGRWWCYRSTVGDRGDEPRLPTRRAAPMAAADARLRRIFHGISPQTRDDAPIKPTKKSDGGERAIEVAWPGQPRGPLRPAGSADAVAQRFGAEMAALAPACDIR
jgi:hypothetical protein